MVFFFLINRVLKALVVRREEIVMVIIRGWLYR